MAVEVISEVYSIATPEGREKYNSAAAEQLDNGWDVLSTVPFAVKDGKTSELFVTYARDLEEDDEEETDEE